MPHTVRYVGWLELPNRIASRNHAGHACAQEHAVEESDPVVVGITKLGFVTGALTQNRIRNQVQRPLQIDPRMLCWMLSLVRDPLWMLLLRLVSRCLLQERKLMALCVPVCRDESWPLD